MKISRGDQRPVRWESAKVQAARLLGKYGLKDADMAIALSISVSTLTQWKNKHPEFEESYELGRQEANLKLIDSAFLMATDRWVEEEHIINARVVTVKKFVPGNPWITMKLLAHRMPDQFSESRHRIDINQTTTNINIDLNILDENELRLMESIQFKNKAIPENLGEDE
jgi:hypothetical protein